MAARPLCEADDCEDPATFDLHQEGKGCMYVCSVHRDELLSQPNWTLYELGAHPHLGTPIASAGLTAHGGGRVELDGTPARERAWRP